MIDYSSMLNCAAAHLKTSPSGERMHITDMQLASAGETKPSLELWAVAQGLEVTTGAFRGHEGWWLQQSKAG